ncbi:MAG TPA: SEC-C metal-binding domain-containing protein [Actinoplanes sp.]|nr:SEC-C metal-binding domain-containing protein [Actinoplanes sp.]
MTVAKYARGFAGELLPLLSAYGTDGVALVHELTVVERDAGVLAGDDDLALWTMLADDLGGLPLAGGGQVRAAALPSLPVRMPADRPAGRGLIGQGLVGPAGWLAGFAPGDLLEVRVRDGSLSVSSRPPDGLRPEAVAIVVSACQTAARQAVDRYADGHGELPAAVIAEVLVEVMRRHPAVFAEPLPPLRRGLSKGLLEAFGGHVGLAGISWNIMHVRGLDRSGEIVGVLALAALVTWDEADTGHLRELLDRVVSHRGVVGYLADEIERRTAIEGVSFVPVLDWLATTARTPAERAAVTLFRARAAEGAGDCVAAQRLVTAALAEEPDLKAALLDAGEYAACRGDLVAADDYLRRAGHPVAENLRAAIRSQHVAPAAITTGRNRPCPCGSGRKAKVCHATTVVPPLTVRAELLYALIATFVQRAPAADRLGHLISRSTGHPQHPLLCLDLLLANEGYLQRFLKPAADGYARTSEPCCRPGPRFPSAPSRSARSAGVKASRSAGSRRAHRSCCVTGCSPPRRGVSTCSAAGC